MFTAKDIMTIHVVTVHTEDTVDHAVSLMVRHRISGLPVLDRQDRPVGIVSEYDLLSLVCQGRSEHAKVRDYMSFGLYVVSEDDSWVTVADIFRTQHVRRLPVLREGRLVGIVSRHDLLQAIRDARRRIHQKRSDEAQAPPHERAAEATPPAGMETSVTAE